jgi:ADP-L-glycero-D-manno-heptose 6-epimerase
MILVTGGSGFIGSNLVSALAARGERVVIADWLGSDDKWRNVAKSDFCELVAPEALDGWLARPGTRLEAVVHLGAISATTETDADLIYDTNVRLSVRLWQWCADHGVPLVYASSAATYGDGSAGFDDDMAALAALRPLNPYGWSKHFFDRFVAREVAAGRPQPPQWAGLKFFNVYGPNEYHKGSMQSVVAQKFPSVASGAAVTLFRSHHPDYPDGGQMRDFVYVDDCVEVMLWLLDHTGVSGLFNLGTGTARSFADLANALARAAGVPPRIEFIPMPEALRGRYQYFTQARMERLRAAGYSRPFTTLEDGIGDYVSKYLACPDRYR